MLVQVGIGPRVRKWINCCFRLASISILVNGCPTEPFKIKKGVRQGDPISLSLFTLIGESLSMLIRQDLICSLQIGKDKVQLTHMQFTDDTLLFISHETEKLMNYRRLLHYFSVMIGLYINFSKSSCRMGIKFIWVHDMSVKLGYQSDSTDYLFRPSLGVNCKQLQFLKLDIEKIEQKLSTWRSKLLSKAGRAEFISSILKN